MRFSTVPKESKTKINRAGKILVRTKPGDSAFEEARNIADKWRSCHAYPINTFQSTLRRKVKIFTPATQKKIIIAQRLKRMPTIIDKLNRYPSMQLTTMQDIGGVRAVLESVKDVYKLANDYKTTHFEHQLVQVYDYITEPRDEDGYRGLHLVYKYKNKLNPTYDGLRIELQLRTKRQHIWATAVETMGTFLGQALKSRQGDQKWIDFFAITSSAFAYKENSPRVPRFEDLSRKETFLKVAKMEKDLLALHKMRGFSAALKVIVDKEKKWSFHLIVLNSLKKTIQIKAYDRESFTIAMKEYSKYEAEAANGAPIEPVLVSAGPIQMLRQAYPNFFLDIGDFVYIVTKIVNSTKK